MSIARNFLAGQEFGRARREEQDKRNALAKAAEAFNAGRYDEAQATLMPVDPDAAMRFADWGQASQERKRVKELGAARASGGWKGVQDYAKRSGDFDAMTLADQGIETERAQRLKREKDDVEWTLTNLMQFHKSPMTPEQRQAQFVAQATERGIGADVLAQLDPADFTDDGIIREAQRGRSFAEQLSALTQQPSWQSFADGSIGYIDEATGQIVTNDGRRLNRAPRAPVILGGGGSQLAARPGGLESLKLTESQGKTAASVERMLAAERLLAQFPQTPPNFFQSIDSDLLNPVIGAQRQQIEAAQEQWAEAYLRATTGAAVTRQEAEAAARMYFPRWGDNEGTIQQKEAMRRAATESLLLATGPAGSFLAPNAQQLYTPQARAFGADGIPWRPGAGPNNPAPPQRAPAAGAASLSDDELLKRLGAR